MLLPVVNSSCLFNILNWLGTIRSLFESSSATFIHFHSLPLLFSNSKSSSYSHFLLHDCMEWALLLDFLCLTLFQFKFLIAYRIIHLFFSNRFILFLLTPLCIKLIFVSHKRYVWTFSVSQWKKYVFQLWIIPVNWMMTRSAPKFVWWTKYKVHSLCFVYCIICVYLCVW